MKKILLAAGIILIPGMAVFAQDPIIKSAFTADFPDAENVHYARVKNLNEISFTQAKQEMYAYYDDNLDLIGTIRKDSLANLPENAKKEIQKKYPGYAISGVVTFDENGSDDLEMILDGTPMDDADNYFVELKNDSKALIVKVDLSGGVDYLTKM